MVFIQVAKLGNDILAHVLIDALDVNSDIECWGNRNDYELIHMRYAEVDKGQALSYDRSIMGGCGKTPVGRSDLVIGRPGKANPQQDTPSDRAAAARRVLNPVQ